MNYYCKECTIITRTIPYTNIFVYNFKSRWTCAKGHDIPEKTLVELFLTHEIVKKRAVRTQVMLSNPGKKNAANPEFIEYELK